MGLFSGKAGAEGTATVLAMQLKSWRQAERRNHDYTLSLQVRVPGHAARAPAMRRSSAVSPPMPRR